MVEINVMSNSESIVTCVIQAIRDFIFKSNKSEVLANSFDNNIVKFSPWYNNLGGGEFDDGRIIMQNSLDRQSALNKFPKVWKELENYFEYPIEVYDRYATNAQRDDWRMFMLLCEIKFSNVKMWSDLKNIK